MSAFENLRRQLERQAAAGDRDAAALLTAPGFQDVTPAGSPQRFVGDACDCPTDFCYVHVSPAEPEGEDPDCE